MGYVLVEYDMQPAIETATVEAEVNNSENGIQDPLEYQSEQTSLFLSMLCGREQQ